jgi:hypothetical protein
MLCDRCHEREVAVRARAVSETGALLRTSARCEACARTPRRIGDEDVRGVLALEASGRAMPAGWYALAAEDFARRAAYHGDPIPADVQAFVDRHRPAAT